MLRPNHSRQLRLAVSRSSALLVCVSMFGCQGRVGDPSGPALESTARPKPGVAKPEVVRDATTAGRGRRCRYEQ